MAADPSTERPPRFDARPDDKKPPRDLRTAKITGVFLAGQVLLSSGARTRFVRAGDAKYASADRTQVVEDASWFSPGQSVAITYRVKDGLPLQVEVLVLGPGDRVVFAEEDAPSKAK